MNNISDITHTNSPQLLFVGENSQDCSQFLQNLIEENISVKHIENSIDAIHYISENTVDVVLIKQFCSPLDAQKTLEYLNTEQEFNVPVLIILESEVNVQSSFDFRKTEVLSKELNSHDLKKVLNLLVEVTSQGYGPSTFSLQYLRSIGGDNEQFLIETFEIFKSSVTKQLKILEEAIKINNPQDISGVAHNIKPSFEMLMNDSGRDLCDKLTYELNKHKPAQILKELKIEYSKIEHEMALYLQKNPT
ncbi:hypothetical protein [Gramella sp. AN32]|uniref:Hpt domain-containing protein n=1 Tax=Christiangramia antarctica TaxID=2058158 RepID=A0ABW5X9R7_9FLAO|nr:hypothetical protein [Gramella sp. AN32]MCM4157553.1 hypothetical protein [Gramella sp. AN32]